MQSEIPSARGRRWWPALKWLLLLVGAGAVLYQLKFRPLPVVAYTVTRTPLTCEVMGTGTLEARVKTTISPRLQERLAEVRVDQGDTVKSGQLLARLDDGELTRQVAVAEAELASAQAMVERVREDEARASAVALQARREHQRVTELQATRVTSVADLDKAAEQLGVAEAELRRAGAASREAQSAVATAERSLAYHRERLGFTRIAAPYDGLVVRRDRDPGGVVVPGSSLLQIISTNELWISAWVDETAMARLATGEVARVVFRSEPTRDFGGQVARLGRETDRETREFLVDVRVNELPANWAVGQRAEVYIAADRIPDAVAVPGEFIQWRDGRPGVWVLAGGRADWREVTPGRRAREAVEILRGVAAGDEVIRPPDPAQSLQPGRRVRRVPAPTGRAH